MPVWLNRLGSDLACSDQASLLLNRIVSDLAAWSEHSYRPWVHEVAYPIRDHKKRVSLIFNHEYIIPVNQLYGTTFDYTSWGSFFGYTFAFNYITLYIK
jgi:hypothetical protein